MNKLFNFSGFTFVFNFVSPWVLGKRRWWQESMAKHFRPKGPPLLCFLYWTSVSDIIHVWHHAKAQCLYSKRSLNSSIWPLGPFELISEGCGCSTQLLVFPLEGKRVCPQASDWLSMALAMVAFGCEQGHQLKGSAHEGQSSVSRDSERSKFFIHLIGAPSLPFSLQSNFHPPNPPYSSRGKL